MPPLVAALVVGLLVPFLPVVARVTSIVVTVVHETGHAVVVVPFGGRIRSIVLRWNGSGEAVVDLGRVPRVLRPSVRIVNLLAGYGAPLWVGVVLIGGVVDGRRLLTTIALGVVGVVALLFVRNAFGIVVVLAFDALAVWCALRGVAETAPVVFGLGVALVVGGLLAIARAGVLVVGPRGPATDFHLFAREFHIPAALAYVVFLAVNGGAFWLARAPLAHVGTAVVAVFG